MSCIRSVLTEKRIISKLRASYKTTENSSLNQLIKSFFLQSLERRVKGRTIPQMFSLLDRFGPSGLHQYCRS